MLEPEVIFKIASNRDISEILKLKKSILEKTKVTTSNLNRRTLEMLIVDHSPRDFLCVGENCLYGYCICVPVDYYFQRLRFLEGNGAPHSGIVIYDLVVSERADHAYINQELIELATNYAEALGHRNLLFLDRNGQFIQR